MINKYTIEVDCPNMKLDIPYNTVQVPFAAIVSFEELTQAHIDAIDSEEYRDKLSAGGTLIRTIAPYPMHAIHCITRYKDFSEAFNNRDVCND